MRKFKYPLLLLLVLSVDIDQMRGDFPQNRKAYQPAIDPADIFPRSAQLPGEDELALRLYSIFSKQGQKSITLMLKGNKRLHIGGFFPVLNQLPISPAS